MPLTDAVGDAIREQLSPEDQARLPERRFDGTGGRFEEWLSYLAEEQPHLTEDRSLELVRLSTELLRLFAPCSPITARGARASRPTLAV